MKKTLLLIPLILVFFITVGFSAFETNLLVDSIGVEVRPYKLVRVTNIEKSVLWAETTTGSKVDITIGGYFASNKTVKQKAKMEVLDFYVRKVST